jgi:two-component system, NarL family, nitrate/nitrite response regulator NarL
MRVAIIADIRLYREGLAQLLGREQDIEVQGTAADSDAGVAWVTALRPDIALLDMAMLDSAATVRRLAESAPEVKVVALAVPETEPHVLACAEAGIAGYVPRDGSLADLVHTLKSVARGEVVCSPRIAASLLRRVASLAADRRPRPGIRPLTGRELEIVELIDQGSTNKEIAELLSIEVSTVKNHVHNILDKLHLRRRTEVAAWLRGQRPRRTTEPVRS